MRSLGSQSVRHFVPALVLAASVAASASCSSEAPVEGDAGTLGEDRDASTEDVNTPSSSDAGSAADEGTIQDAIADAPYDASTGRSLGCTVDGGGASGVTTRTLMVDGKTRTFLQVVPAGYTPGTPIALVLGYHGSGGTSAGARTQMAFEKNAAAKAIVVYPQALASNTAPFVGVNRWEIGAASNDYPFFDAIVAAVGGSHCVDTKRVLAAGFSNGAEMVAFLGCKRGAALRAVAPVAPGGGARVLESCTGDVAEWTGVGNQDADHQVATLSVRDHYVTANGCMTTKTATTPAGCSAYNGCRTGLPVVFCTYDLGHAWPTFASAGVWGFFNALP